MERVQRWLFWPVLVMNLLFVVAGVVGNKLWPTLANWLAALLMIAVRLRYPHAWMLILALLLVREISYSSLLRPAFRISREEIFLRP